MSGSAFYAAPEATFIHKKKLALEVIIGWLVGWLVGW